MTLAPLLEGHHPPCDNEAQAAARQIVKELNGSVVHLELIEDADAAKLYRDGILTPEEQMESGADRIVLTKAEYIALKKAAILPCGPWPRGERAPILVTKSEYDSLKKDSERLDLMEAERLDVCERNGDWLAEGPNGPWSGRPDITDHSPRAAIDRTIARLANQDKKA